MGANKRGAFVCIEKKTYVLIEIFGEQYRSKLIFYVMIYFDIINEHFN